LVIGVCKSSELIQLTENITNLDKSGNNIKISLTI
jgi:hypothetical protein